MSPLQEFVEKNIQSNNTDVMECFTPISIVNVNVRDNLTIQSNGRTDNTMVKIKGQRDK